MIDLFSPALLKAKAGFGDPSEVPSSSLACHGPERRSPSRFAPAIQTSMVRARLTKLARIAQSIGYSHKSLGCLPQIDHQHERRDSPQIGGGYLVLFTTLSPEASRIVDKMPHNFQLIGLIALLFPKARIIHCRRDAIDTCLSCFTTSFQREAWLQRRYAKARPVLSRVRPADAPLERGAAGPHLRVPICEP